MRLKLINYLLHRDTDNFELHLVVIINLIAAILAIFSMFTGEILANTRISEDLGSTGYLTYISLFWLTIFICAVLLAEFALHKDNYHIARKISVYSYSFIIIPAGLYITGSISIAAMHCVLSLVLLNIIAQPQERYIINPFLLIVMYVYIVLNYQFPGFLPPEPPKEIVYLHFLINTPIVLIIAVMLAACMTESYRRKCQSIDRQTAKLDQILKTDRLTGLYNKTYLNEQLPKLLNHAYEQKSPLVIFLVDIDFFKNYNTLYGNIKGDSRLIDVASILKRNCFNITRHIYRFGGEEFAIVLPDTDQDGARILAESIVEDFRIRQIDNYRSMICNYITVSIGIYCYSGTEQTTPDDVIKNVDSALYRVKRNGRNGYYIIDSTETTVNNDIFSPSADQMN